MQLARQILDLPSALRVLSPRTLPYPALADLGVDLGNAPSDTQAPGDAQEPGEPVTAEPGLRDLARMVERLEHLSQQQHDLMLRQAHFESYMNGKLDWAVSQHQAADASADTDEESRVRRRRRTMHGHAAFTDNGLLMLGDGATPQQSTTGSPLQGPAVTTPSSGATPRPQFGRGGMSFGRGRGRATSQPTPSPPPQAHDPAPDIQCEQPRVAGIGPGAIGRDWFPTGCVASFTGIVDVASMDAAHNPLVWTRDIRHAMTQRNIPPHMWTAKCKTCLAPRVIDRFVSSRAGSDVSAITQRFVDHVADPLADTPWDTFVDWLLHAYVTPGHVEAMALQVERVRCKDVTHVQDFIADFNAACVAADYLALVIIERIPHGSSDLAEGIIAASDTAERRRHFRAALPPVIQAALNQAETSCRLEDPAWFFTLPTLQRSALTHAETLQSAAQRGEATKGPQLHHVDAEADVGTSASAGAAGASLSDMADLRAQMAQLMHICTELSNRPKDDADDSEEDDDNDDVQLFVRVTDVMQPPPPIDLIERRRRDGSCLACGEAHRWIHCPKITADAGMAQRLRDGLAADNARRTRRGRAPSRPGRRS